MEPIRILHVDDNPDLANMAASFLEREDERITTETATSADDGLECLRETEFDCIVSDYDMPGQDGIELLRRVRNEWPDVPFILYTGKGSEEVASEAISAGVTDYLQKETGNGQYTVLANRITNAVDHYCSKRVLDRRNEELRDGQEFMDQALNALTDVFYVLNEAGIIQRWNKEAVEVTGYSPEKLDGMPATECFPESDRQRIADAIERTLEEGEATVEAQFRTADGAQIPYEFTSARVTDTDGETNCLVGIGRDISRRKQRTEQLQEFISVVSHDLRNPLNIAAGKVDLARNDCDSDHLDGIREAIDRSQALIDDLLTLAQHGETIGSRESVSVSTLAEESWQTVPSDEATLNVDDDLSILADRSRFRQLLENLFSNAIEHGGEAVTVTVGYLPDGFYIEDDGGGIPDGERNEVFGAGYSTRKEGTGFGLRIVKQIVKAHGWEIRIAASDEGGARFEISDVTAA